MPLLHSTTSQEKLPTGGAGAICLKIRVDRRFFGRLHCTMPVPYELTVSRSDQARQSRLDAPVVRRRFLCTSRLPSTEWGPVCSGSEVVPVI